MALNTIEDIIEDIRHGKMVVLLDDENRENEGDLIVAAEKVTPEIINFMASKARGLICLTLTGERCDFLGLPPMVGNNNAAHSTPFTVSIEAAEGVTTGISAADRAHTISVAVDPKSTIEDIVQPGHIFPLRAQPGGVLSRAGHTEAGCDLARLAGLIPSAAIVEIMNEDGTMARLPDLIEFAQKYDLKIGTIADLIHYRILHERTIREFEAPDIETKYGDFHVKAYHDEITGGTHLALVKGGPFNENDSVMVRVHVASTLRDLLGAKSSSHQSWSLQAAMTRVSEEGSGVVVLLDENSSFDIETELKMLANDVKVPRNPNVDKHGSYNTIGTGSQILRDLGIRKMRLLSSPTRFGGISGFNLEVVEFIEPKS